MLGPSHCLGLSRVELAGGSNPHLVEHFQVSVHHSSRVDCSRLFLVAVTSSVRGFFLLSTLLFYFFIDKLFAYKRDRAVVPVSLFFLTSFGCLDVLTLYTF